MVRKGRNEKALPVCLLSLAMASRKEIFVIHRPAIVCYSVYKRDWHYLLSPILYDASMTARILHGSKMADGILDSLRDKVRILDPKLVIVQVGSDPASTSYI